MKNKDEDVRRKASLRKIVHPPTLPVRRKSGHEDAEGTVGIVTLQCCWGDKSNGGNLNNVSAVDEIRKTIAVLFTFTREGVFSRKCIRESDLSA